MLLIYARFILRQIHVGLADENNREAKVTSRQKKSFTLSLSQLKTNRKSNLYELFYLSYIFNKFIKSSIICYITFRNHHTAF